MGIPQLTVVHLAAQGEGVPQGARAIPELPRGEVGAVAAREGNLRAPTSAAAPHGMWAVFYPGFGPGWPQPGARCAHTAQPEGSPGDNISAPRGKQCVGREGQPGGEQSSADHSVQPLLRGKGCK